MAGGGLTGVGLAGEPDDEGGGDGQDGDGAGALLGDGAVGGAVYGAQEGLVASSSASTIAVGVD